MRLHSRYTQYSGLIAIGQKVIERSKDKKEWEKPCFDIVECATRLVQALSGTLLFLVLIHDLGYMLAVFQCFEHV